MGRFLTTRLLTLAATLAVASVIVFLALDILPGNAALTLLGADAAPEAVAALTRKLGLDRPAMERYFAFAAGLLHGDFGTSAAYDTPAVALIGERLAVSLPLALMAMCLTIAMALALGLFAASRRGTWADTGAMALAQTGMALPNFWLAILLVLLFAVHLHWLPAGGFPGWDSGLWPGLRALLLPALSLALVQAAVLARVTRSSVLDVLGQDFVRTARAKGLSQGEVLRRHVLRNALAPVLAIAGLQFANLVASAIVIENVFSLPGLGRLIFQSIGNRDTVVVRDCVLLLAAFVIAVNFVMDVLAALADPRLKTRTA